MSNNNTQYIDYYERRKAIINDLVSLIANIIGNIGYEKKIKNKLMTNLALNLTSNNNQKIYITIHYTIKVLNEALIHNFSTNSGEYLNNRINNQLINKFKDFCINSFNPNLNLNGVGQIINRLDGLLNDDQKVRLRKILQFIIMDHSNIFLHL
jgi:hypothetical protein